jgi:glycosyltransferase involved in cell wall biosynthesis
MEKLVTIIIPVFNSEKYLDACLSSVTMQTFSNLDIIIVDNCSTDNSGTICKKWVKQDSRITYIKNSQNMGLSFSRNVGLNLAKGTYICFADSDDTLQPTMISSLVTLMDNHDADLVSIGVNRVTEQGRTIDRICNNTSSRYDYFHYLKRVFMGKIAVSVYSNIYKKSIISSNNISFKVGGTYEDMQFNYQYYKFCSSFFASKECLYNYYIHSSSQTVVAPNRNAFDMFSFQDFMLSNVEEPLIPYLNRMIITSDSLFFRECVKQYAKVSPDVFEKAKNSFFSFFPSKLFAPHLSLKNRLLMIDTYRRYKQISKGN